MRGRESDLSLVWELLVPRSNELIPNSSQHENGDLCKIKVCVNLRKVGHPTLRRLATARKGL